MGRRRARVLREAAGTENEIESPESDELLSSVLMALENEPEHSAEHDWEDQRWLSDIMYHLLGRLAGRARRQGTQRSIMTEDAVIEGMSTSLGLYESQDMPLLEELAAEFSSWLSDEPNQSYPAGWGRIVHDRYRANTIYLEPFDRNAPAATETVGTMTVEAEPEPATEMRQDALTQTHEAASSSSS